MPKKTALISASVFVLVFIAYSWFAWAATESSENRAAQFGDAFGALNTLISGLALFGVIYAVLQQQTAITLHAEQTKMQAEELKLQREELEATRAEIARGAEAQQLAAEALASELKLARFRLDLEVNERRLAQVCAQIQGNQSAFTHGRSVDAISDDNIRSIIKELQQKYGLPARADPDKLKLAALFERVLELRVRQESLYIALKKNEKASERCEGFD